MMTKSKLNKNLLALAVTGALITATPAISQESTGTIRGSIMGLDEANTVKIIDNARGIARQTDIAAGEAFRFTSLPPGEYTVQVLADGELVETRIVSVTLGSTANVLFGEQLEEVVVQGTRDLVVDTGIAESGLVMNTESLKALPVARSLTSVTLLAPSVTRGDAAFGGTSFSGASVAENISYVNGLNTTNFRNGLGFSKVPFEFYDTIQVKTGGYSAKFGRSTGGVMNATTKSGTNEFQYGANFYYTDQIATSPNTYINHNNEDVYNVSEANIFASGPIIEDRLFFYALYSKEETNNEYYRMTGRGFQDNTDANFWGLKLDGYITEDHRVELTAFSDERETVGGRYYYNAEDAQILDYIGNDTTTRGGMNWLIKYTGDITDDITLSVAYGENEQDRSAVSDNTDRPAIRRYNADGSIDALGSWVDIGQDEGVDTRKMYRIDISWALDAHLLEAGIDNEKNSLTENSYYSGQAYWRLFEETGSVQKWHYSNQGGFKTDSSAFYIQDTWDITNNLTLQAGLRNETFVNKNKDKKAFIDVSDQWAPRVAAIWDFVGDGKQKIFATYGHYYIPVATNTNIRMGGDELFYIDVYGGWDGECLNEDLTPCDINLLGTVTYGDGEIKDARSLVDKNIEPMYQTEYSLGYEYITDNDIKLGVKGIYRNIETALEDIAIDGAVIDYYNSGAGTWDADKVEGKTVEEVFEGVHQYVLTNPGTDMKVYIPEMEEFISLTAGQLGYPKAERQYGAVEFTFERPFDGKWSLNASYTWAHSWGNNEGYVRSDNGQTDAGLTTNYDIPGLVDGAYGDLPNDRRHTIKAFGNYQFDMGLRLGANFMWQTGRPKNCFGIHPTGIFEPQYGAESFYCQGELVNRGTAGREETFWNLDISAQYTVSFADNQEVLLTFDIFNVLNNKTILETQEIGDIDDTSYPQPPNPNYGKALTYQTPTRIRFGARYEF